MALKRVMFAAFVAFLASAATIKLVAVLSPKRPESATGLREISAEELSRHGQPGDCWLEIEGKVYDVTRYIPLHPAAPKVLGDWCGKEATEAFNTKGYGRPHGSGARALLARYFVGERGP